MTEDDQDRELVAQARQRQTDLEARHLLARVRHRLAGVSEPVKVGRYTINRRIGAGAMGRVFAAYDPQLQREVAIKVIEVNDARPPAHLIEEARALARLTHPNVVEVYDVVVDREQLRIVMQLLHGVSLSEWGKGKSQREVLRAFVSAGRGLAAAHAQGICHRDFKPSNVIVDAADHVRLVDFGLSHASSDQGAVGTPAYVAPERRSGRAATRAQINTVFASRSSRPWWARCRIVRSSTSRPLSVAGCAMRCREG